MRGSPKGADVDAIEVSQLVVSAKFLWSLERARMNEGVAEGFHHVQQRLGDLPRVIRQRLFSDDLGILEQLVAKSRTARVLQQSAPTARQRSDRRPGSEILPRQGVRVALDQVERGQQP